MNFVFITLHEWSIPEWRVAVHHPRVNLNEMQTAVERNYPGLNEVVIHTAAEDTLQKVTTVGMHTAAEDTHQKMTSCGRLWGKSS